MNGRVLDRTRFLCRDCSYTYSVRYKKGEVPFNKKFQIMGDFLLHLSRNKVRPPLRKFAEANDIHHATLIKWLDKYEYFIETNPEYKDAPLLRICKHIFKKKKPSK